MFDQPLKILVPELVPLANKGEEAILRGYEAMFVASYRSIEFGVLGATQQVQTRDNVTIFPRTWVQNAIWPGKSYKRQRLLWDSLHACGLRGRIRNVFHRHRKKYCKIHDFFNDCQMVIVGHDGAFNPASAILAIESKKRGKVAGILGCGFPPRGVVKRDIITVAQERSYRHLLKVCDFAIFRERNAIRLHEEARKSEMQSLLLAPDPAFLMSQTDPARALEILNSFEWYREARSTGRLIVGITICQNDVHVVPFMKSTNSRGTIESYWEYLAAVADGIVATHDPLIIVLPHCIEPGRGKRH